MDYEAIQKLEKTVEKMRAHAKVIITFAIPKLNYLLLRSSINYGATTECHRRAEDQKQEGIRHFCVTKLF